MTNLQPTLENDLVLMRALEIKDFEALYEVASNPKIWELHQNPDRWELPIFKDFFKGALDSKGAFVIIDKATNGIIGSSRFKRPENSQEAIEIGWTFLSRAYWGGVYNASFKSLMIAYAFEHFDYILFHVDHQNHRSQRAVEKLGGVLLDKKGSLGYLHTPKETGLTFILYKTGNA
ncbi:MAG: GNAT family N-acetyltransferase [Bacteroidota bacterium]